MRAIAKKLIKAGCTAALFASAALLPIPVTAQDFPSSVIRILVPTSAATPPDILARVIANEVSEAEGWKVVVENKPGAVMILGGMEVLRAPAHGHTIFAVTVPITAAPSLVANIPFDVSRDFDPVGRIATTTNVLVVNPSVPARTMPELIAYLKANPGKATYSSGGFGTPAHLVEELFKLKTGVDATHVPYNQFPQAIGDLISGINIYQFIATAPVLQLIQNGQRRALAVTGSKRLAALPDVPTVIEAGYPDLVYDDWAGFLVKAGTSKLAIDRLNTAIRKAVLSERVRAALSKLGSEAAPSGAEEYGQLIRSQIDYWAKIVTEAGIKMRQ